MSSQHRKIVVYTLSDLLSQSTNLPLQFGSWPSASKSLLLETCRYFPRLDSILHLLSHKPIKQSFVRAAILLGLSELVIFEKPVHAVIHEYVNIIKASPERFASGFVNACLRRFIRESQTIISSLENKLEFLYAHPDWLIKKIQNAWPDAWQTILEANNQHGPMTLRVNLSQISRQDYMKKAGIDAKPGMYSCASLTLAQPKGVDEIEGFDQGLVSVQDEAFQVAASLLKLQPHLRVLDACAAPGGKTAHILETFKLDCTALEPQAYRFTKLNTTLKRLHLQALCIEADATEVSTWWDGKLFDRILIDAPCSGSGVIRRHPDFKLRNKPSQLLINVPIQAKLLSTLWPLLAPGGLLLYATCSILIEENDAQIQDFLNCHSDARADAPSIQVGIKTQYGQQILPGTHGMDGCYYALIQKLI